MSNKKLEAEEIIKKISSQLKRDFDNTINNTNSNTRGQQLETYVKIFLEKYLNGICNFYVRAHIIDNEMEYLDILPQGQNEIDIVAVFKNTYPSIIWEVSGSSYIIYDSVSFIVEVKQNLNKQNLSKDLDKLKKISSLKINDKRFNSYTSYGYALTSRPVKVLLYFEKSIDFETENSLLNNYIDSWDILINLNEDIILINKNLPFYKWFDLPNDYKENYYTWRDNALYKLISIILPVTLPYPHSVNTINTFLGLYQISMNTTS